MTEPMPTPTIPESLISSRLLMLQSKRLILASLERRFRKQPLESLRTRVDHTRQETLNAHERYCLSLLTWGTAETPHYWPVAYGRLVDTADRLSSKLRGVARDLPYPDRYQAATDVEMLESFAERWRQSIRTSITAVA